MILKYFSIFIALLVLGTIADIPVMFLGVRGELSLYFVFIVGFLTDVFSDLFWYWLGRRIGIERFERLRFFKQKPERMNTLGRAFDKYGMFMLFCSKFIHSFGTPTQIIAGARKYPKNKFILSSTLGATSLLLVIYGLALIFTSEVVVERYLKNTKIALLMFFVVIAGLHFLIKKPVEKILMSKNAKKSNANGYGDI